MGNAGWIVLGHTAGQVVACGMRGSRLTSIVTASSEIDAIAGLKVTSDSLVRIGDGTPDQVPCAVLPVGGQSVPVVTQDQPMDVLGAWVRVWIAGYLAGHEGWDGVICATEGDVTHWVHISAGEIVSFASFLTPRLIGMLNGAESADLQALADCQSRPEKLAAFLRQAELAGDAAAVTGYLIGAELAAARVYWLGQEVVLIAPEGALAAYDTALTAQGVHARVTTPDAVLPNGLAALGRALGVIGS